ncbi:MULTISPECIES: Hpt domain-containing protein [Niastella]|uniref:Hpt domain-containing protein n=1 Tax=Niastella soli TaxID=2821487 RepID=A0ABS3YLI7_9BACT|nr:Hpt domain-containing protein [Niastella soli]MBO9198750.1 Hpt domain-containing protein [Niastella soli]
MSGSNFSKKFIFNEKLDANYLYSLYEDDYQYIEEIFLTTLANFNEDFNSIKDAFETNNISDLKRAIHKMKPTFGFVGLPLVQNICKEFEDICQNATSSNELTSEYQQIVVTLAESKELIASEYNKLKEFNSNFL